MPSLMMMTSIISEESLARDTYSGLSTLKFAVTYDTASANKN